MNQLKVTNHSIRRIAVLSHSLPFWPLDFQITQKTGIISPKRSDVTIGKTLKLLESIISNTISLIKPSSGTTRENGAERVSFQMSTPYLTVKCVLLGLSKGLFREKKLTEDRGKNPVNVLWTC